MLLFQKLYNICENKKILGIFEGCSEKQNLFFLRSVALLCGETPLTYLISNFILHDQAFSVSFAVPQETQTRSVPSYVAFQITDILFGSLSIMNLVVLTFERLLAVAYPTFHFNLTKKQIGCALSLTWILSSIFAGVGLLAPTHIAVDAYLYMLFALVFVLPTITIIGCYIVIFQVARNSAAMANRRVKKDLKIARMILMIIGLFLICWLPFFTLSILYYNCSSWCDNIPNSLIKIVKALHYSNSMMNFWVYAVRSPDYRRSFSALIRWRLPRFRSDTMTSYRLRQRTMSNPTSSLESEKRKGTLVNNETMCTPLPDRSNPPAANGVAHTQM